MKLKIMLKTNLLKTVKRLVLLLGMLAFSIAAQAEWAPVAKSQTSLVYVDSASLQKTNDGVRFRRLTDFVKPQTENFGTFMSYEFQEEMDCKGARWRVLSMVFYSKVKKQGDVVSKIDRVGEWVAISPDTKGAYVMQYVCNQVVAR